jgi:hypothetical protein
MMRRRVLDAVFFSAFAGLPIFGLWFLVRCIEFLFGSGEPLNPSLAWRIFWVILLLLWTFVAMFAVFDLVVRTRRDAAMVQWRRVLAQHFLVMGPTAYYLAVARPAMGGAVRLDDRRRFFIELLDSLVVVTSWSPILMVAIILSLIALPKSLTLGPAIALAFVVLIVIPGFLIYPLLQVVFIAHAMSRVGELPTSLTPWAWVFGQRKYYRETLRPELVEAIRQRG